MKIKNFIYIFLAGYLGTFLRLFIDNNFIISILGSFFVGFLISKRLSYLSEKILLSGFFSCFTSFSGFFETPTNEGLSNLPFKVNPF